MAKFSQAFLQGLMQPTYQQGLFEAARSVGQAPGVMGLEKRQQDRQEKERAQLAGIMTGDPSQVGQRVQQLRQLAVQARSTEQRQRYTLAADALEKSARTKGIQDISVLMGELDRAVDPRRIDQLQQQISDISVSSMQSDPTRFVGLGSDRKEQVTEMMEDQSARRIDNLAGAISRSSVDIPSYIDNLPSIKDDPQSGVTEAERASLLKASTDLRQIRDDHTNLKDEGTLPASYREILDNNKELRESPAVADALAVLARAKDPDQTVNPGAAATAANTIRDAVTTEYGRQLEIDRSTNRLERKANNMVENLLTEGGISEWVYGEDLVEIVDRIKDEGRNITKEMKDDFYSFIAQEIEKNPDVDRNVAIKTALDLLGEEYDIRLEEGREQNVEERQQEEADRQAAIAYLMETEELSRKDAIRRLNTIQAERLVSQVAPMIP
tara:strand:- start:3660 stop:4979 length:1320 start_codon:yes stop_codon:yes gene_type:complete